MTQRIDITVSENVTVVDIMLDVDISVLPDPNDPEAETDLSTLLSHVLLERTTGKTLIKPNKYNIRMFCVVTTEESNGTDQSED